MIKKTSSKIVYENRWMTIREDTTELPDGTPGLYGVVDKPDFAVILPVHDNGDIQLVEQYRYPVERRMWELPQGGWPAGKKGTAVDLAQAELSEETGLKASGWRHVGHFHATPALSSQGYDLFVATGLTAGAVAREATEQDMRTGRFSLADIREMIRAGQITCAVTIAAIGLYHLDQSSA